MRTDAIMNLPFPIPIEVLYAGLAGTLLSLIVATAMQHWRPKVFFLLALRLAIGWHFLFEGLYKIHSYYTGPNESTKVFTSEPYFKVAPGPVGGFMRKQFDDPLAVIETKATPTKKISPEEFGRLKIEEQAAACPEPVAKSLDDVAEKTADAVRDAALTAINEAAARAAKAMEEAKTEDEKTKARTEADAVRIEEQKKVDNAKDIAQTKITAAKAAYARWVYGVDGRDTKVKVISGADPKLSAIERREHLDWLRREAQAVQSQQGYHLGNGNGMDSKRAADLRMDLLTAETDLAKDTNAFVNELRQGLTAGKAPPEEAPARMGKTMDFVTMWFLVGVGTSLLAGFLCRLGCVLGAGFLVVTYLNHPAFPWFPLPPGTEGNPVFVNKNIIECLAMLSLACMPTGRWMGLDALFLGVPRDKVIVETIPVKQEPPIQPRSLSPQRRG